MIKLFKDGVEIPFKQWKFPGGEVGVQLLNIDTSSKYVVHMLFEGSDDIMVFLNVCDALSRSKVNYYNVTAYIPYLPYARQDRVCNVGESFALEVFIYQLAQTACSEYTFCDIHSKVGLDMLDFYGINYTNQEQWKCAIGLPEFDVIIAPDKGAMSKIYDHTQVKIGNTGVVCLSKTRIDSKIIYKDYEFDTIKGNVCVMDDLVDGGKTFIEVAKMLRKTQPNITSLSLYVTHGIFSKGIEVILEHFDKIYVHNLMNNVAMSYEEVVVI